MSLKLFPSHVTFSRPVETFRHVLGVALFLRCLSKGEHLLLCCPWACETLSPLQCTLSLWGRHRWLTGLMCSRPQRDTVMRIGNSSALRCSEVSCYFPCTTLISGVQTPLLVQANQENWGSALCVLFVAQEPSFNLEFPNWLINNAGCLWDWGKQKLLLPLFFFSSREVASIWAY